MSYKLVAIDIDGTLLNDQGKITPRTRMAIARAVAAGIWVTLCTGRGAASSVPIAQSLPLNAPLILNGGGLILSHHGGDPLYFRNLPQAVAYKTLQLFKSKALPAIVYEPLPDSFTLLYDAMPVNNPVWSAYIERRSKRARRVADVKAQLTYAPSMISTIAGKAHIMGLRAEIARALPETNVVLEVSPLNGDYCVMGVYPREVSKGQALGELARILRIDLDETVAIGDNYNDLDLLDRAGLAVAMGNAHDVLKQRADLITRSNIQDGVAEVLEKYVLAK